MNISPFLGPLKEYVEREDFQGYDPYDALNSPILRTLSFRHKCVRLVFIQALKKMPVNLRPLLKITKGHNPKGLGLFLSAYSRLHSIEPTSANLNKINYLLNLLENLRSRGYSGNCWGYNFDWQSRAFYLPKFTPTIVNTSFIGHAMIDCYQYANCERALKIALSTRNFIINDLNRKREGAFICFSYSPLDESYVHNANLLGASLLIRLYGYTKESHLKDLALASLGYSMKHQKSDGSWPYAETGYQDWTDSFHTGFNLQSLLFFLRAGFGENYAEGFERGVQFYRKNFFLEDGTPKYYHNKIYPLDIHAAAQGVAFFSQMGSQHEYLAEKIARWMAEKMRDQKGYFYFQKTRFLTNKISYMRWAQAWTFFALTELLFQLRCNSI